MPRVVWPLAVALAAGAWIVPADAYDGIVEKQVFAMPEYTTTGGATIKDVRIGWEAYGELNEAKDNVILITTSSPAPATPPADTRTTRRPAIGIT